MKIAVYSGEIPSTAFIEKLIAGLAGEKGHEVLLFGKKKREYTPANRNIKLFYFPSGALSLLPILFVNLLKMLPHINRFKKLIKITRSKGYHNIYHFLMNLCRYMIVVNNLPDIFHVQWIKSGDEWLFLQDFGVKVIGSFRGAHINYSPIADVELAALYRKTFPLYDGFHAVSSAITIEAEKYSANTDKVWRIPGAINPHLLKIDITNRRRLSRKITIKILSIGREHWKKGYHYALDACKLFLDNGIDFQYTIIGAKRSEELIFQIQDLGLEKFVILKDNVTHNSIFDYYKQADIFLLPSVEEGIANVVLEAMAIGIPVISTDCGGMNEVIEHGRNGLLVPVRDPERIAGAIIEIVNGKWDVNSMVINARETIKNRHLLEKQLDGFDRMYRDVLRN